MKKLLVFLAAAGGFAFSANAAVVSLESVAPAFGGFRFDYQGTLGPDEGVRTGSRFIIFDFAGYVAGSIFAPTNFSATAERVTGVPFLSPGHDDRSDLFNLVFTYSGPDFRTADGPFGPIDFNGFGAISSLSGTTLDGFFARTIKNNPSRLEGTPLIHVGSVLVPTGVVPEPATWALMIGGFGLVGTALRRKSVQRLAT